MQWLLQRLKLCHSLWENTPQKNTESYRNQSISLLCKSSDSFPHNTSLCQRYLQKDFNGTFKGTKKKKKENHYLNQSRLWSTTKCSSQSPLLNSQLLKPVCRKPHPRCSTGLWSKTTTIYFGKFRYTSMMSFGK